MLKHLRLLGTALALLILAGASIAAKTTTDTPATLTIAVLNDSVVFNLALAHSQVPNINDVDSVSFQLQRSFIGSFTDTKQVIKAKVGPDSTTARLVYPLAGIWNPGTTITGRAGIALGRVNPEGAAAGLWSGYTYQSWSWTRDLSPPAAPPAGAVILETPHYNSAGE